MNLLPDVLSDNSIETDERRRFGGMERLYGNTALARLQAAHCMVVGIGGVGSWCAEALARSGIGQITLVDMDHISESNINRQLHALSSTLGESKVRAMATRIHQISPSCSVQTIDDFLTPDNAAELLAEQPTALIDCSDQVDAKIAMILESRRRGIVSIVCGGAGGKTNPFCLRQGDLALASHDALLARLRNRLRREHGFARSVLNNKKRKPVKMGVQALWFEQETRLPDQWQVQENTALQGLSCAGYGSAVTITAPMGMAAAHYALQHILAFDSL